MIVFRFRLELLELLLELFRSLWIARIVRIVRFRFWWIVVELFRFSFRFRCRFWW